MGSNAAAAQEQPTGPNQGEKTNIKIEGADLTLQHKRKQDQKEPMLDDNKKRADQSVLSDFHALSAQEVPHNHENKAQTRSILSHGKAKGKRSSGP